MCHQQKSQIRHNKTTYHANHAARSISLGKLFRAEHIPRLANGVFMPSTLVLLIVQVAQIEPTFGSLPLQWKNSPKPPVRLLGNSLSLPKVGVKSLVKRKGATSFVQSCNSYPCFVLLPCGGTITPALFHNTSNLCSLFRNSCADALIIVRSSRSRWR